MTGTEHLTYERVGATAVVTMNRPEAKNALSGPMLVGMADAWVEIDSNDDIRCAILTGAGGTFCAGMDLKSMSGPGNEVVKERMSGDPDLHWKALLRHYSLKKPLIAAVEGYALAGGCEMALACDLIVAAEPAKFGLVEKVVGLTPAMGGTQRLAERAGSGRAKEFVMTGIPYDASTLERWNVVNRVWPADGFDAAARELATELANGPTLAHAATKRVIRDFQEGGVELANDRVPQIAGELFDTEDLRGAVASFLVDGPGKAAFSGR